MANLDLLSKNRLVKLIVLTHCDSRGSAARVPYQTTACIERFDEKWIRFEV